jgi:hypothetical protein
MTYDLCLIIYNLYIFSVLIFQAIKVESLFIILENILLNIYYIARKKDYINK